MGSVPATTRRAGTDDIAAIVRVINRAYRVEDFFIAGDRTTAADVAARMASPGAAFLVIDDGEPDRLAGAVYVHARGGRGYFGMLSVDPERQNRGLGRALVEAVEAHCRAHGCDTLEMDVVNLREELPAFYRSLGFEECGTAPFNDPHKLRRPAHLVLMAKPLEGR